jgi:hypothetical protein
MPIETDLNKLSANSQRIAELNAASQGMTAQQYVTSRGGINTVTGGYGDSVRATDLTDAQYQAAVAGKTGTDRGLAIGTATAQNIYNAAIAAIAPRASTETQAAYEDRVQKATNKAKSEQSGSISNQTNAINSMLNGTPYTPLGGADGTDSGGLKSEAEIAAETAAAEKKADRQSAYDLLYSQFAQYGLESLVEPLKGLITSGASPAEFTIKLRESEPYKKRFAANAQRITKGLRALDEADYLALEDQYQNVMRQYGLPESYYTKDATGKQPGFEQLIANDISNLELGDRLMVAQDRVLKSNPEVMAALKAFYPGINNGDILAYTLDPKNAIKEIQRKVTTAEIGGAAARSGLTTNVSDAEYLQRYGVTKETATQGYTTIAGGLQRGSQLASIYGEDPYTQATAETEVFNVPGAAEARKQRQKITGLEKATFGGQSGISQGALARDRAGAY